MSVSKPYCAIAMLSLILAACNEPSRNNRANGQYIAFPIAGLSNQQYPDNPDIGSMASGYTWDYFTKGAITVNKQRYAISFYTKNGDTIAVEDMDFSEFIPTIPDSLKPDTYLSYLACINQEWNRNQVRFEKSAFVSTDQHIARMDISRNCLNAYLWEVILYVKEQGNILPFAHGWFNFPKQLYLNLFEEKNGLSVAPYLQGMENWIDPASKQIHLGQLRSLLHGLEADFQDASDMMYPLSGARKKKYKEIIYPEHFSSMRDLQSDSTLFATFSPPGYYNKKEPRRTELGRFFHLDDISLYRIKSRINGEEGHELQLLFSDRAGKRTTAMYIGGLNFSDFPVLPESECNQGWKKPMGFSNHSFYEDYNTHESEQSNTNPYYAFFTDAQGRWIDSHRIGVDGPVFHFADGNRKELHLWLLSFERHAFIGHYIIRLKQ